jgi:hypothetical protein
VPHREQATIGESDLGVSRKKSSSSWRFVVIMSVCWCQTGPLNSPFYPVDAFVIRGHQGSLVDRIAVLCVFEWSTAVFFGHFLTSLREKSMVTSFSRLFLKIIPGRLAMIWMLMTSKLQK